MSKTNTKGPYQRGKIHGMAQKKTSLAFNEDMDLCGTCG